MNVLIFSPHPDDEILGAGGLLALMSQAGAKVTVIYLTSGDAGSLEKGPVEMTETREGEAREGASVLGIKDLVFLRNPDGFLEYSRENLEQLVRIIRDGKPSCVLMPHEKENHPDHRIAHKLVREAVRRAAGKWFFGAGASAWRVSHLLCYEVLTPMENVSSIVDITAVMELKLSALRAHKSQLAAADYEEAITGLNRYRGALSGNGKFCECFLVLETTMDSILPGKMHS